MSFLQNLFESKEHKARRLAEEARQLELAELQKAVRTGNVQTLKELLKKRPDADVLELFHTAMVFGRDDAANLLLQVVPNINAVNSAGRTLLHQAAEYNRCAVALRLLDMGANVDLLDANGMGAAGLAAAYADYKFDMGPMLNLLVEGGANCRKAIVDARRALQKLIERQKTVAGTAQRNGERTAKDPRQKFIERNIALLEDLNGEPVMLPEHQEPVVLRNRSR